MRLRRGGLLVGLLALAGLAWVIVGWARAQEAGFTGNWKVTVLAGGVEADLWIIQVDEKDGKLTGKILSVGLEQMKGTTLEGVQVRGDALQLDLNSKQGIEFKVTAYAPKGQKAPKTLLGTVAVRGHLDMVRMQRTDAKELDPTKAVNEEAGARKSLLAAFSAKGAEAQVKALQEFLKEHGQDPLAQTASLKLLQLLGDEKAGAGELRARGEETVKLAAAYGPEMEAKALADVTGVLLKAKGASSVAVHFAREAQKKLGTTDPAARQKVLKNLVKALSQDGQEEEARTAGAELAKVETVLDQIYLETAVPFKVQPYPGPKGKGGQAALVELFTGAQCPPCVAADVAFDALLKTYKSGDVVLLQYHLHIPGPDALTNKASEERSKYYEIQGTPSMFIDGQEAPPTGGPKAAAQEHYQALRKAIEKNLEEDPTGQLKLTAVRKGDKIEMTAEVSALKKAGKDVRLRFVLLEEKVRYVGSNGQRFHHHIVRDMPGGADGLLVAKKDGTFSQSVDLRELRKSLEEYLSDYAKKRPFREDERPLELNHLAVAAFVQDDANKEVLACAQAEVSAGE